MDLGLVLAAGIGLFHVPMRGSWLVLITASLLFLLVILSMGILISAVSDNEGQAIQLAILAVITPQILLSGLVFPLSAMAADVRWLAYLLPLTYSIRIARAVMQKGTPPQALGQPFLALALLSAVTVAAALWRFWRLLAPRGSPEGRAPS